jgi:hypothetical protein
MAPPTSAVARAKRRALGTSMQINLRNGAGTRPAKRSPERVSTHSVTDRSAS